MKRSITSNMKYHTIFNQWTAPRLIQTLQQTSLLYNQMVQFKSPFFGRITSQVRSEDGNSQIKPLWYAIINIPIIEFISANLSTRVYFEISLKLNFLGLISSPVKYEQHHENGLVSSFNLDLLCAMIATPLVAESSRIELAWIDPNHSPFKWRCRDVIQILKSAFCSEFQADYTDTFHILRMRLKNVLDSSR